MKLLLVTIIVLIASHSVGCELPENVEKNIRSRALEARLLTDPHAYGFEATFFKNEVRAYCRIQKLRNPGIPGNIFKQIIDGNLEKYGGYSYSLTLIEIRKDIRAYDD